MNEHNQPAFPSKTTKFRYSQLQACKEPYDVEYEGMTLRDYFAGQALTQLGYIGRNPADYKNVAECCYGFADAMLAERFKEVATADDNHTKRIRND